MTEAQAQDASTSNALLAQPPPRGESPSGIPSPKPEPGKPEAGAERAASPQQRARPNFAAMDAGATQCRNHTGFIGVRRRNWGMYAAEIRDGAKRRWLGSFNQATEAGLAYDAALVLQKKHRAKTNFAYECYLTMPRPGADVYERVRFDLVPKEIQDLYRDSLESEDAAQRGAPPPPHRPQPAARATGGDGAAGRAAGVHSSTGARIAAAARLNAAPTSGSTLPTQSRPQSGGRTSQPPPQQQQQVLGKRSLAQRLDLPAAGTLFTEQQLQQLQRAAAALPQPHSTGKGLQPHTGKAAMGPAAVAAALAQPNHPMHSQQQQSQQQQAHMMRGGHVTASGYTLLDGGGAMGDGGGGGGPQFWPGQPIGFMAAAPWGGPSTVMEVAPGAAPTFLDGPVMEGGGGYVDAEGMLAAHGLYPSGAAFGGPPQFIMNAAGSRGGVGGGVMQPYMSFTAGPDGLTAAMPMQMQMPMQYALAPAPPQQQQQRQLVPAEGQMPQQQLHQQYDMVQGSMSVQGRIHHGDGRVMMVPAAASATTQVGDGGQVGSVLQVGTGANQMQHVDGAMNVTVANANAGGDGANGAAAQLAGSQQDALRAAQAAANASLQQPEDIQTGMQGGQQQQQQQQGVSQVQAGGGAVVVPGAAAAQHNGSPHLLFHDQLQKQHAVVVQAQGGGDGGGGGGDGNAATGGWAAAAAAAAAAEAAVGNPAPGPVNVRVEGGQHTDVGNAEPQGCSGATGGVGGGLGGGLVLQPPPSNDRRPSAGVMIMPGAPAQPLPSGACFMYAPMVGAGDNIAVGGDDGRGTPLVAALSHPALNNSMPQQQQQQQQSSVAGGMMVVSTAPGGMNAGGGGGLKDGVGTQNSPMSSSSPYPGAAGGKSMAAAHGSAGLPMAMSMAMRPMTMALRPVATGMRPGGSPMMPTMAAGGMPMQAAGPTFDQLQEHMFDYVDGSGMVSLMPAAGMGAAPIGGVFFPSSPHGLQHMAGTYFTTAAPPGGPGGAMMDMGPHMMDMAAMQQQQQQQQQQQPGGGGSGMGMQGMHPAHPVQGMYTSASFYPGSDGPTTFAMVPGNQVGW